MCNIFSSVIPREVKRESKKREKDRKGEREKERECIYGGKKKSDRERKKENILIWKRQVSTVKVQACFLFRLDMETEIKNKGK